MVRKAIPHLNYANGKESVPKAMDGLRNGEFVGGRGSSKGITRFGEEDISV